MGFCFCVCLLCHTTVCRDQGGAALPGKKLERGSQMLLVKQAREVRITSESERIRLSDQSIRIMVL